MGGVMDVKRGKRDRSGYCRQNKEGPVGGRQTRLCLIRLSAMPLGLGMNLAYITLDGKRAEGVHRMTGINIVLAIPPYRRSVH